jgi:hypothetical protein
MWGSSETLATRLAVAVPALALGLAAGVLGGVLAAQSLDTTPYGPTEFNTASRQAHEKGRAEGLREATEAAEQATAQLKASSDEHLARVTDRLAKTRKALKDTEKRVAEQKAEILQLHGSVAEKTAALDNATSQDRAGGTGQHVEGTLKSVWTLGPGAKPWPTGCAEPLDSYEVRVTAGEGATVAEADLVNAEVTRQTEKKNSLTLVCSLTYAVNLPTPLGSEYQFVVEAAESDRVRTQARVSSSTLEDESGPLLTVTR